MCQFYLQIPPVGCPSPSPSPGRSGGVSAEEIPSPPRISLRGWPSLTWMPPAWTRGNRGSVAPFGGIQAPPCPGCPGPNREAGVQGPSQPGMGVSVSRPGGAGTPAGWPGVCRSGPGGRESMCRTRQAKRGYESAGRNPTPSHNHGEKYFYTWIEI